MSAHCEIPRIDDLSTIPVGDMPGDSIQINSGHVDKATAIFPRLWELLTPVLEASAHRRAVISVHGG